LALVMNIDGTLQKLGSLSRLEKRNLIEKYCEYAYLLPVHKMILFRLYYYDGYTIIQISQFMMKPVSYVRRRIVKATEDLSMLFDNSKARKGTLVFYPQYCRRCFYSWIGKKLLEPCTICGKTDRVSTCDGGE